MFYAKSSWLFVTYFFYCCPALDNSTHNTGEIPVLWVQIPVFTTTTTLCRPCKYLLHAKIDPVTEHRKPVPAYNSNKLFPHTDILLGSNVLWDILNYVT